MSSASLEKVLDDILCGGPVKRELAPTTSLLSLPKLSGPLTVMGLGNVPVVIEDPVRFRKDMQTMVMAQMMNGLPDAEQLDEIDKSGSMIEIATVKQMVKASYGDLDSYRYMMDRVLGKPVNQTNTVSVTVSYESMLDELDPDEVIKPKKVYCDEV